MADNKGKLVCHECKEPLSPEPGESYLILRKETKRGYLVTAHYYLCKKCLKNKTVPKCDNKECKYRTCNDPDMRLGKIHFDYDRMEVACLKCGMVFEDPILTGSMAGAKSAVRSPPPKEPKDYNPLVQQLANDSHVDWFNCSHNLILTCTSENYNNVFNTYPEAKIITV